MGLFTSQSYVRSLVRTRHSRRNMVIVEEITDAPSCNRQEGGAAEASDEPEDEERS